MTPDSLEQLPVREPDLEKILDELTQAATDQTWYLERIENQRAWWHCTWAGQTYDGRKHSRGEQDVVLPWDGASDSRLRIVDTLIDQHVTLDKTAFANSRIQCRSVRPLQYGRQGNIAQKVLEWLVYTQMRQDVLNELPLAWAWKYAYGLSFISVEWERQTTKGFVPITMETMQELSQRLGAPMDMNGGEESDNFILDFLQGLSEILDRDEARKILSQLRNDGMSQMPVVNITVNRPYLRALLPGVDVLIPSETHDLQRERWVSRRELVVESQLVDRIKTDGYDADFVEEALKHKGEFSDFLPNKLWRYTYTGSERDMVELHHFFYKSVEDGIPCLYRTIFSEPCISEGLYAVHRPFEYQHQQYPLVPFRRARDHRNLLSSHGIAEEAYTDEMDIKVQQDGLTDRTDLIHNPPMILPTLRAQGLKSSYGPRAVMSSLRPGDVNFPPLPPSDNTPMEVIAMVQQRLNERYGIVGNIDPQFKAMRQRELSNSCLGDMELVLEMVLQLAQQYLTDEEVQRVAGNPGSTWNVSAKDIQGRYEISVTYDMKLSDIEYVKELLQFYSQAMQFNQTGSAKLDKVFSRVLSIFDPDFADLIEEDQQSVTERERNDEKLAATQILSGIEPDFPMHANHQLRMQTLVENTLQSKNPSVQQIVASRKDVQQLLKSRVQNFQRQIQQQQINPIIGRTLATKAMEPSQPAEMLPY